MKLLLDTQVALWWLTASPRLSKSSRMAMTTSASTVSVASIWEIAIKHRLGKLPVAPGRFRDELLAAGITVLPVTDSHVVADSGLPASHTDPFDRLLVAVAAVEELSLFTADEDLVACKQVDPRLPISAA